MRVSVMVSVLGAAALLAACGRGGQEKAAEAPPPAPTAPPPTSAEKQALLAKLPAPYNTADLANGEAKFGLCKSCHTVVEGGANLTGPNLHGVMGRKAGAVEGFNYSEAMKTSNLTWDAAHLDPWLADPRGNVPGTKMSFVGLKNAKDRADVIAYLMVEAGPTPQ